MVVVDDVRHEAHVVLVRSEGSQRRVERISVIVHGVASRGAHVGAGGDIHIRTMESGTWAFSQKPNGLCRRFSVRDEGIIQRLVEPISNLLHLVASRRAHIGIDGQYQVEYIRSNVLSFPRDMENFYCTYFAYSITPRFP